MFSYVQVLHPKGSVSSRVKKACEILNYKHPIGVCTVDIGMYNSMTMFYVDTGFRIGHATVVTGYHPKTIDYLFNSNNSRVGICDEGLELSTLGQLTAGRDMRPVSGDPHSLVSEFSVTDNRKNVAKIRDTYEWVKFASTVGEQMVYEPTLPMWTIYTRKLTKTPQLAENSIFYPASPSCAPIHCGFAYTHGGNPKLVSIHMDQNEAIDAFGLRPRELGKTIYPCDVDFSIHISHMAYLGKYYE